MGETPRGVTTVKLRVDEIARLPKADTVVEGVRLAIAIASERRCADAAQAALAQRLDALAAGVGDALARGFDIFRLQAQLQARSIALMAKVLGLIGVVGVATWTWFALDSQVLLGALRYLFAQALSGLVGVELQAVPVLTDSGWQSWPSARILRDPWHAAAWRATRDVIAIGVLVFVLLAGPLSAVIFVAAKRRGRTATADLLARGQRVVDGAELARIVRRTTRVSRFTIGPVAMPEATLNRAFVALGNLVDLDQGSVPRARIEGEDGRTTEWRSKALPRYQRLTRRAEALCSHDACEATRSCAATATQPTTSLPGRTASRTSASMQKGPLRHRQGISHPDYQQPAQPLRTLHGAVSRTSHQEPDRLRSVVHRARSSSQTTAPQRHLGPLDSSLTNTPFRHGREFRVGL